MRAIRYATAFQRHCERSEAIHSLCRDMDCFAALAMTVDIVSPSRGADRPRFASSFALLRELRAQGRPGARCTRGLACNLRTTKRAHEHTGAAGAFRPSLRNGFTAYFELSPVNGFLATVAARRCAPPRLSASTAASGPHDFAVRVRRVRLRAIASIASHRTFVTMLTPLICRETGGFKALISPTVKAKSFSPPVWTPQISLRLLAKFDFGATDSWAYLAHSTFVRNVGWVQRSETRRRHERSLWWVSLRSTHPTVLNTPSSAGQ